MAIKAGLPMTRFLSVPRPRRLVRPALLAVLLLADATVMAAQFDALCGRNRCRITVTDQGFEGPAGFIPAARIAQWNALGWDSHNALIASLGATGGAVTGSVVGAAASCWTLIACPVGILAGAVVGGVAGSRAGRSADYRFSVEGFDSGGRRLVETFRFINRKPVPQLVERLTRISGLTMGKVRSVVIAGPPPVSPQPIAPTQPQLQLQEQPQPPASTLNTPQVSDQAETRGTTIAPSLAVPAAVALPGPRQDGETLEAPTPTGSIDPYQGTPVDP
jgi:hypothetical protein